VKRALDFVVSLGALLVLAPLMLYIAWRVRREMGSPVLFAQWRPGLKGKPFRLYKFRTMREAYDKQGQALPDEERLTPLGSFLRRSSLDELPELVNIMRGEMSLVGPRPLMLHYLPLYNKMQNRRHEMRPGLTGWAQVNGRNATTWDERFAHDIWYIENWNIFLDIWILILTVERVIRREGTVAMAEFKGND